MSSNHYDVIVTGVETMGASACWYLAKRNHKVLGLEQFDIPHDQGAHAGQSRIIRKAYYENFPYWFTNDDDGNLFYGFPILPPNEFSGPVGLKLAHHK